MQAGNIQFLISIKYTVFTLLYHSVSNNVDSQSLFSALLREASVRSREDAHRPGGGRAAQRALGPGLLRGAAQAQAQVRARQQQDGARFLCGQKEQYIIVSQ